VLLDQISCVELPSVWIVILHWAHPDDTLACLRSLAEVDYAPLSAIVVVNGSTGFPDDAARASFPGLHLLQSDLNLGFSGGNNLGITHALDQGADRVMLLNNDTAVSPDLVRALLPPLDDPAVGIAGPVITYFDRPDTAWFAGGTYRPLLGYTFHPGMDRLVPPVSDNRPSDFITGCTMMVRRDVFGRIGLLWEELFLYFEDAEFCLRAGQAGIRCALVPRPLVRHKVSASAGQRGSNRLTPDRAYYFGRNPLLMARRLARRSWPVRGGLGFLTIIVPIMMLRLARAGDLPALRAYCAGVRDGLRGRTGRRPA